MAGVVPDVVSRIQRRVLDGDVRRIADHRVIALAENAVEFRQVFGLEGMHHASAGQVFRFAAEFELPEAQARAVQQAVAGGQVEREIGRIGQPGDAGGFDRGNQQPEAGDGDGQRG